MAQEGSSTSHNPSNAHPRRWPLKKRSSVRAASAIINFMTHTLAWNIVYDKL